MNKSERREFLEEKVAQYNRPSFIPADPISVPHRFSKLQDIEIAGLFAATFAWGQRLTIINKCDALLALMDHAPHDFIINHEASDLKKFNEFKHRTFNYTDLLYFIHFLRKHYSLHHTLETAFISTHAAPDLVHFHNYFFDDEFAPQRTKKHVSTPNRKSACKRLNMFLRWMVRRDNQDVDFGLWHRINPANLICPLDVHVGRTARQLDLLNRKQDDWLAANLLTEELRKLDPLDPVKYDFALFGIGVMEKS